MALIGLLLCKEQDLKSMEWTRGKGRHRHNRTPAMAAMYHEGEDVKIKLKPNEFKSKLNVMKLVNKYNFLYWL